MAERRIFLVRHGQAEDIPASGKDFDRALTDAGITRMEAAGRGLASLGVAPEYLVASPYVRARQTADCLARGLEFGRRETWEELGCGVDPLAIVARIEALSAPGDVMLVGHEPDMGELLSFFLTGGAEGFWTHFRKGAVACVTAGMLPPMGRGQLEWFERAVALARLGGE